MISINLLLSLTQILANFNSLVQKQRSAESLPDENQDFWLRSGQEELEAALANKPNTNIAKVAHCLAPNSLRHLTPLLCSRTSSCLSGTG